MPGGTPTKRRQPKPKPCKTEVCCSQRFDACEQAAKKWLDNEIGLCKLINLSGDIQLSDIKAFLQCSAKAQKAYNKRFATCAKALSNCKKSLPKPPIQKPPMPCKTDTCCQKRYEKCIEQINKNYRIECNNCKSLYLSGPTPVLWDIEGLEKCLRKAGDRLDTNSFNCRDSLRKCKNKVHPCKIDECCEERWRECNQSANEQYQADANACMAAYTKPEQATQLEACLKAAVAAESKRMRACNDEKVKCEENVP